MKTVQNLNLVRFAGWVLIVLGAMTVGTACQWYGIIDKHPMASLDLVWRNAAIGIALLISGALLLLWAVRARRHAAHV